MPTVNVTLLVRQALGTLNSADRCLHLSLRTFEWLQFVIAADKSSTTRLAAEFI